MSYVTQCPICTCILFNRKIVTHKENGERRHVSKCENGHIIVQHVIEEPVKDSELNDFRKEINELRRRIMEHPDNPDSEEGL